MRAYPADHGERTEPVVEVEDDSHGIASEQVPLKLLHVANVLIPVLPGTASDWRQCGTGRRNLLQLA
jgi:hypothetical protein